MQAIENVAQRLGNTPAICRKCYIHPEVIGAYLDGTLLETLKQRTKNEFVERLPKLRPEEAAVLALLQERLATEDERLARQLRASLQNTRKQQTAKW